MIAEMLFPFENPRDPQVQMLNDINLALKSRSNMIIHAPTGIGKTAAALSPALSFALKNKLTVFFLTSRHTQHHIAIETLKKIKQKHNLDFTTSDLIGKHSMCLQPVQGLRSSDFYEYCKKQVDDYECEFYINARKRSKEPTAEAKKAVSDIIRLGPQHVENVVSMCERSALCPYEISSMISKKADVVISDYFTIFEPNIRASFLGKSDKKLEESIIIVDEGHNLPQRLRDLQSIKLSTFMLKMAIKEADKFRFREASEMVMAVKNALEKLGSGLNGKNEEILSKDDFLNAVKHFSYDDLINTFAMSGDEIREKQRYSYIGSVGSFLEAWLGNDEGFIRSIVRSKFKNEETTTINYLGLDPSILSMPVIKDAYSTILMSGTLTPTSMYKDVLGFENAAEKEYKSPFPKDNRLNLIIPGVTTKFTSRNEQEFMKIASMCADISENVPGNVAVFFPSYDLRDKVYSHFIELSSKKVFLEDSRLSKQEKAGFLEEFAKSKEKGAVLLSAATGSFGEGIDMPDVLKAVIIVGIPLAKPDLETNALIDYYQKKYSKGLEYGYLLPAIIKSMQNAGRCIRSERDRGVIVFMDERYTWRNYYKCFPLDWDIKITKLYTEKVKEFFKGN